MCWGLGLHIFWGVTFNPKSMCFDFSNLKYLEQMGIYCEDIGKWHINGRLEDRARKMDGWESGFLWGRSRQNCSQGHATGTVWPLVCPHTMISLTSTTDSTSQECLIEFRNLTVPIVNWRRTGHPQLTKWEAEVGESWNYFLVKTIVNWEFSQKSVGSANRTKEDPDTGSPNMTTVCCKKIKSMAPNWNDQLLRDYNNAQVHEKARLGFVF